MWFSICRRYVAGHNVPEHACVDRRLAVAALRRPPRHLGMIPLSLGEIAAVVGGTVEGDRAVTVTAPAVLDGRQAEPGGLFVAFAGEPAAGHAYAHQAARSRPLPLLPSPPPPPP